MTPVSINAPVEISSITETGAAVAESIFGNATAAQENTAIVEQAQQSAFFHQFVL